MNNPISQTENKVCCVSQVYPGHPVFKHTETSVQENSTVLSEPADTENTQHLFTMHQITKKNTGMTHLQITFKKLEYCDNR